MRRCVSIQACVPLGLWIVLAAVSAGCQRRRESPPPLEAEPPSSTRRAPPNVDRIEAQRVQPPEMTPQSVAGVYAVRRTTQSSSCEGTEAGEVLSTIWVLDATPTPRRIRLSVYGATTFTNFSSSIHANTLELVASSDQDVSTTMTVTLSPVNVQQLQGSETVALRLASGGRCVITRAVSATRLN